MRRWTEVSPGCFHLQTEAGLYRIELQVWGMYLIYRDQTSLGSAGNLSYAKQKVAHDLAQRQEAQS